MPMKSLAQATEVWPCRDWAGVVCVCPGKGVELWRTWRRARLEFTRQSVWIKRIIFNDTKAIGSSSVNSSPQRSTCQWGCRMRRPSSNRGTTMLWTSGSAWRLSWKHTTLSIQTPPMRKMRAWMRRTRSRSPAKSFGKPCVVFPCTRCFAVPAQAAGCRIIRDVGTGLFRTSS